MSRDTDSPRGPDNQSYFLDEGELRSVPQVIPLNSSFSIDDEFLPEEEVERSTKAEIELPAIVKPTKMFDAEDPDRPGLIVAQSELDPEPLSAPAESVLSVSELLENGCVVDWPAAVAIVRRICQALAQHPSAGTPEYFLDPRHIEITEAGDVRVLPGAPGGDPFVKQVGRILRTLLETGNAPVTLRLLASQAAFELPGYATVQELSEALRVFEEPGKADTIRKAFRRGRDAKFALPAERSASSPIEPRLIPDTPDETMEPVVFRSVQRRVSTKLAAGALALALIGAAVVGLARRFVTPIASSNASGDSAPMRLGTSESSVSATEAERGAPLSMGVPTPPDSRLVTASEREPPLAAAPAPPLSSTVPRESTTTTARRATIVAPGSESQSRLEDLAPLPAERDRDEALRRKVDGLVLANPLYQFGPAEATPEAIAALQDSKRVLLPSIAGLDYVRARTALESGDFDRALAHGTLALQLMNDRDFGPVPGDLRASVQQVLADARAEQAREANRVYTEDDDGVVLPIALGRQLPAMTPAGLSSLSVGQLEMLIDRNGEVELVKLHTPLNRYHERMIVSAAKAWKYRPAMRNGRPVRFLLFRSVNLPES